MPDSRSFRRVLTPQSVLLALLMALHATSVRAQSLVADVDPSTTTASSSPEQYVASGGLLFFSARTGLGAELFVSDGTAGGTRQVFDALPGRNSGLPTEIADLDGQGRVFFVVNDVTRGREPWVSDGTTAGTFPLGDLRPGVESSNPDSPFRVGNLVYFGADDGVHGQELWVTDGTVAGTRMVVDLWPGANSGYVQGGAAAGNRAVFMGVTAQSGGEPFASDGTAAGTVQLVDTVPGSTGATISRFLTMGGQVMFASWVSGVGSTIWRTGGTAATTFRVFDLFPATDRSVGWVGTWNGLFFFTTQQDLYVTAGSTATTRLVQPPAGLQNPAYFAPTPRGMIFTALSNNTGRELWISDGSDAGTQLVTEVRPGFSSGVRGAPAVLGGRVVFQGDDGSTGREPWISDGTAAGTRLLRDVVPGSGRSNPDDFIAWPGRNAVVFSLFDAGSGDEPWITNGTTAGTRILADVRPPAGVGSRAFGLTALDEDLLFIATDPQRGAELRRARPGAGVTLLEDHLPGPSGSQGRVLGEFGGSVYYSALTPAGWRLFRTDGQPGGAIELAPLEATFEAVELGGRLLFSASPDGNGTNRELWATDGTVVGTQLVRDLNPSRGGFPQRLHRVGNSVFFIATDGVTGLEWYRSDGTAAGTVRIADLTPGSGSTSVFDSVAVGDLLYFVASIGSSGRELWVTDGSAAGTRLVRDIVPGSGSSFPSSLAAWRGLLWFAADDGVSGRELWVTDGTAANTRQVLDLRPGPPSASPASLTPALDRMYFIATDFAGAELWSTDGTAAGTAKVRNIRPGAEGSSIQSLTAFGAGDMVLFSADDGQGGDEELWVSDGTWQGTRQVADLNPEGDARPRTFVVAGRKIWFLATTEADGEEPWVLDAADVGVPLVVPFGSACAAPGAAPELRSERGPRLGELAFAVRIEDAQPSAATALVLGTARQPIPIGGGCELAVGGSLAVAFSPANAQGTARFGVPIPNVQALVGIDLWLVGVVADASGPVPGGYSLTPGLRAVIGRR